MWLYDEEPWEQPLSVPDRPVLRDRPRRLHVNRIVQAPGNGPPPQKTKQGKKSPGGHAQYLSTGGGGDGIEDGVEIVADRTDAPPRRKPSTPPPKKPPQTSQMEGGSQSESFPQGTGGNQQEQQRRGADPTKKGKEGEAPTEPSSLDAIRDALRDRYGEDIDTDNLFEDPPDDEDLPDEFVTGHLDLAPDEDKIDRAGSQDLIDAAIKEMAEDVDEPLNASLSNRRSAAEWSLDDELSPFMDDLKQREDWEKDVREESDDSLDDPDFRKAIDEAFQLGKGEKGHGSAPSRNIYVESTADTELAYNAASGLLKLFLQEEDFSLKNRHNVGRYDHRQVIKHLIEKQYHRIPTDRWIHPLQNDVMVVLDVSPSCESQAQMFMAIGASVVGEKGFSVHLNFNGTMDPEPLKPPMSGKRLSYTEAMKWAKEQSERYRGPRYDELQKKYGDRWGVDMDKFLMTTPKRPTVVLIFGDYDGVSIYNRALASFLRVRTKFHWFCNCSYDNDYLSNGGWTPGVNFHNKILHPRDFAEKLALIV